MQKQTKVSELWECVKIFAKYSRNWNGNWKRDKENYVVV